MGVLFLNDNIDTRDNDGEFRLTIMASVAQEESRKISERTRWGQLQAMKRGVVFGNQSLYGYTLANGQLTVEPEQADRIAAAPAEGSPGGDVAVEYLHHLLRGELLYRILAVHGQYVSFLDVGRVEQSGSFAEEEHDHQDDRDAGDVAAGHQQFFGDRFEDFAKCFHGCRKFAALGISG
nr:recombinase family protein [Alistipes indistinctus]